MISVLYIGLYVCAAAFAAGCLVRAVRYWRTPPHLRWELYPVPHEAPERVTHGGSYFEQLDWWTRPREFNFPAEVAAMLAEIVCLKGVWEHHRKLWYRSFPFHFGLYLLIASGGLLGLSASFGVSGAWLHLLYTFAGALGALLALFGAAGLLLRRLTDPEVRPYTTAGDIFNLLAFLVTLGLLVSAYLLRPAAPGWRDVARGILTFDRTQEIPGLLAAGLACAGLLAAWIPLTQMSHFVAKYFSYHSVRWNDEPSRPGGALEKKVTECLGYHPSWSAAHVGADGAKTWVDVALANPAQQVKK